MKLHNLSKAALAIAGAAAFALFATTASASEDDIVIGFAHSSSGWMEAYSGPPATAAKIKIAEINAAGGLLGKQIKFVESDAKTDRIQGAKAGKNVISQGVDLVIVDCDFDMGAPAALAAQQAGLISFFLCAGDPKAGIEGVGPYSFSGGNAAQTEGAALAQWGYEKKGLRKAYMLIDDTIEYDKSVCAGFKWAWNSLEGATIVAIDTFQNSDPTIAPLIDRLKTSAEQPDVIVLCSYVPGGASAVRQIRAAGIDTTILSGVGLDGTYWLDAVPDLSDFCVVTFGSIYGDSQDPELEAFIESYTEAAGEPPATSYPLTGYALIELWSRAVERAGTTETKAVVAELEKMRDEPTIIGVRSFSDQLHIQAKARFAVLCTENGQPSFQTHWTAGPLPKPVLFEN